MTASRSHYSRDFRFNSQPLMAAFTERVSIGGRAWPNVIFDDERYDYAFMVWSNSTLGLLSYWWHSSRQQDGRGQISIRAADSLPVLDFRTLSDDQLATAKAIFDEFRALDLKPAYLADADENRALLDRRVVCDLLGFGERHLSGSAPARRQVVRRTISPRRQEKTARRKTCSLTTAPFPVILNVAPLLCHSERSAPSLSF